MCAKNNVMLVIVDIVRSTLHKVSINNLVFVIYFAATIALKCKCKLELCHEYNKYNIFYFASCLVIIQIVFYFFSKLLS